jgi:hypothetical protein
MLTEKRVGEMKADIGVIELAFSQRNDPKKKRTVKPEDALENNAFRRWFETVKT